jgi:GntR family transcriptional regulator
MLDRNSGIPLHEQLAGLLRERIQTGELPAHSQLPSERAMCDQYGISRITVRKALSELHYEDLVYSSVGKGTYVAEPRFSEELQPLSSFSEDIRRRGMEPSSRVLAAELMPADDRLATRLQVLPGVELVKLHRLRLADGMPVAVQLSHLPHHLCPNILEHDFAAHSLYELLRTVYGQKLSSADTVIEAALAESPQTELLQISKPVAVLISEQTTYTDAGTVIEWTRSVFHGERYRLHTSHC